MMRLHDSVEVGGRKITVREFDAETVYRLLKWLEERGGSGIKVHELLHCKNELLALMPGCIEADDGQPIDFDGMGMTALMAVVDRLQAVNQTFLTILAMSNRLPSAGSPPASD